MTGRQYLAALAAAALLWSCGTPQTIDAGHVAGIGCGADGEVHASATNYSGGTYSLNGATPVPFAEGFVLELDGARAWHLVVTADDGFPTFDDRAGPCRTPSSSSSTPPSSCPDCTPATFGVPGGSTTTTVQPTTTTAPPTPGGTSTTTTVAEASTTTTTTTTLPSSSTTLVEATTSTTTPTSISPAPLTGLPVTR